MSAELNEALAAVGKKQVAFEKLDAEYSKLLQVLAGVVSGDIARSRVLVNLTDRTYLFVSPGCRPPMPATINGLPVCVVGPEEAVGEDSGTDPRRAEPGKWAAGDPDAKEVK